MTALAIIQMKRSGKIDQHTVAHARLTRHFQREAPQTRSLWSSKLSYTFYWQFFRSLGSSTCRFYIYHCPIDLLYSLAGAISRKLAFIRLYFWMVFVHLLLSLGLGIYAIVHNFKDAPKYISECASGSDDPSVMKSCRDGSTLFKAIMIAVFVFVWLLEIC